MVLMFASDNAGCLRITTRRARARSRVRIRAKVRARVKRSWRLGRVVGW